MTIDHPWILSSVICVVAGALEGACSGHAVKRRFSELSLPGYSLPLWAWSLTGVAYYVIHLIVLHSLLSGQPKQPFTAIAIFMVGFVLVANAGWNYLFFRGKDLAKTLTLTVYYVAAVIIVFILLWFSASDVASLYLVYILYLPYMLWWTYAVKRLNSLARSSGA